MIKADGFDNAIIGIDIISNRIIYSTKKCIEILMKQNNWSYDEALEYLEFNTFCAYVGEETPIWCDENVQEWLDIDDSKC